MNKSQIFKVKIEEDVIIDFIKTNFIYDSLHEVYISNFTVYRRMKMSNTIDYFQKYIQKFYYSSKQNYPANLITYKGFNVVLRQLLKYLKISYSYKIKYVHSDYYIEYYTKLI